jgi:hypothetical protein
MIVLLLGMGFLGGQPCSAQVTAAERWQAFRSEVVSPALVAGGLSMGGVDYLRHKPSTWRQGTVGYAARSGSHVGRLVVEAGTAHGVAAAAHLDLRFVPRRIGSMGERLQHAVLGAVTARTADGTRVPNVPRVVGTYGAALAHQRWTHGELRPRSAALSTAISLGVDVAATVVREFAIRSDS